MNLKVTQQSVFWLISGKKPQTLCTSYSFCFNRGAGGEGSLSQLPSDETQGTTWTSCHLNACTQAWVDSADPTQRKPQDWQKSPQHNTNKLKNEAREMCFDTFVQISKCSSRVLKWHPQWQTLLMAYPICGEKEGQIWRFIPKNLDLHWRVSVMTTQTKTFFYFFYWAGMSRGKLALTLHSPYLKNKVTCGIMSYVW